MHCKNTYNKSTNKGTNSWRIRDQLDVTIYFYFTSSMLNMFRTLIHPSSGASDFSVVSPHWLCVLVSMCVGVSVWLGWGGIRVAGWSTASACHTDTTPRFEQKYSYDSQGCTAVGLLTANKLNVDFTRRARFVTTHASTQIHTRTFTQMHM